MHARGIHRSTLLLFLTAGVLLAGEAKWSADFESESLESWYLPGSEAWEIASEGGNHFLHLTQGGLMGKDPRRPVRFAVFKPACVSSFELRLRLRKDPKPGESDLIIAFGYQDRLHFYYAHLSSDDGNVGVHNGLFKVDGADRARIAGTGSKPALPDAEWHSVRLVRNAGSGSIELFMDGESTPRFQVVDKSFEHGLVGIGSFNDTGAFDDFRLKGTRGNKCSQESINTLDPETPSGS